MEEEYGKAVDLLPPTIPDIMCHRYEGLVAISVLEVPHSNFFNLFRYGVNEDSKVITLNNDKFAWTHVPIPSYS